jgi:hypothetical protein
MVRLLLAVSISGNLPNEESLFTNHLHNESSKCMDLTWCKAIPVPALTGSATACENSVAMSMVLK